MPETTVEVQVSPRAVILAGNPSDGYRVIGPFDSFDDAAQYADTQGGLGYFGGWIMGVEAPEEKTLCRLEEEANRCQGCGQPHNPDHGQYCPRCS